MSTVVKSQHRLAQNQPVVTLDPLVFFVVFPGHVACLSK